MFAIFLIGSILYFTFSGMGDILGCVKQLIGDLNS